MNKQFLSRSGTLGGFDLLLLENYYLAAQLLLIYLSIYLHSQSLPGWCQIEESYLCPITLKECVWNKKMDRPTSLVLNPYLALTL